MSAVGYRDLLAVGPVRGYLGRVEARLADDVAWVGGSTAATAAETLAAGGKRLRPLLVLLSAPAARQDDEDLVRAGTAEMLREIGHQVHEAPGGAKALTMLGDGLEIDAVVSDYMMPRMNGAEFAERLEARHPDLPVLIITGYSGDLDLHLPQLAKPFRQADLAAALNRLIGQDEDRKVVPFRRA